MAKGKNKRRKLDAARAGSQPGRKRLGAPKPYQASSKQTTKAKQKSLQPSQQKPTIPFNAGDNILLVGEGDFSFAHSLLLHHRDRFNTLHATCFDSRDELLKKYPQAEVYIATLLSPPPGLLRAPKSPLSTSRAGSAEPFYNSFNNSEDDDVLPSPPASDPDSLPYPQRVNEEILPSPCKILYTIDATKLSSHAPLRKSRPFHRILFNFPHTGGLSTSLHRQVRANQSLLHSFFLSAKPLLSKPAGTVLVTIFEGQPYELWNVRDLARSAGYKVVRSFRFEAGLYGGYRHARTLGNLRVNGKADGGVSDGQEAKRDSGERENGKEEEESVEFEGLSGDEDDEENEPVGKKRPGRWKGEERKARTYEFALVEVELAVGEDFTGSNAVPVRKKRRRGENPDQSSSDESD